MSTPARPVSPKALVLGENRVLSQSLWILLFAGVTALGARVEVPNYPIPFTLQTFVVLLAGAFLGARNGALSQLLYLAIGALGAPVFAAGGIGAAKLLGPTGGYLLAFPAGAMLVGYLLNFRRSFGWVLMSMAAGLLVIFTSGTLHLYAFYLRDLNAAITSGFLIFSWWDMLKLFAAAGMYYELAKRWPRLS